MKSCGMSIAKNYLNYLMHLSKCVMALMLLPKWQMLLRFCQLNLLKFQLKLRKQMSSLMWSLKGISIQRKRHMKCLFMS